MSRLFLTLALSIFLIGCSSSPEPTDLMEDILPAPTAIENTPTKQALVTETTPPPQPPVIEKTPPVQPPFEEKTPIKTTTTETAPAPVAVAISGFKYSPSTLTVKAGTTVTWKNNDSAPHTITSSDGSKTLDSNNLSQGDTFSFIFNSPGTYAYFCAIHPSMKATVIVQ